MTVQQEPEALTRRVAALTSLVAFVASVVVLVLSVSLWFHNSVEQIVTTVVVVSLVLTAVGLFIDRRSSPKGTTFVPIQAAE